MAVGLPTRVAHVSALAAPDDGRPVVLGIVAPGGSDAPAVLDAVAARLAERDTGVLRTTGHRLERDHPLAALAGLAGPLTTAAGAGSEAGGGNPADPADGVDRGAGDPARERAVRDQLLERLADAPMALIVGDAQWLDEGSLRVLVAIAERSVDQAVSLVVAHRPAPGDPTLAALDAALSRRQQMVVLDPLSEDEVGERAALVLGAAVEPGLVELLAEQTAGVPALVDRLARAWVESGVVTAGRLATTPDGVAPSLVAAVRAEVDQLPTPARTVLAALSVGADLDDELLATVTGLPADGLGEPIDLLRAAGLMVHGSEEVVPVVAAALGVLTPVADQRRFHARLAEALVARRAPPMQAAEHLAAAGASGPAAAAAYVAAGEASLSESPELARAWFDRAAASGAPPQAVAAWQAEAAALDGDADAALRLADRAAGDQGAAEADRARSVVAALLPGRGFWRRSGAAYAELASGQGPRADAAAVLSALGRIVSGEPDGAATVRERLPVPAPLELEALVLSVEGLTDTLGDRASGALTSFLEAAELLESAHTRLVLPDSPHALGATVGLALGEPSTADHLLSRALDRSAGGLALRNRHRLLAGWIGLRSGRWAAAQAALDETADRPLAPREVLVAAAVEAGLARRAGDLARLARAWDRADGVLLRHPADLLSLEVVGELAITASRLGHWDRIATKARELGDVVRGLGSPPLWLLPLRWVGLQVALASDDHEAAVRRAGEVEAVPAVHPRLEALADAARSWVAVLGGDVDVARVGEAADGLQKLGLAWEASRLTGQAAIRSSDPSVTRALLEQARDLKATLPSADQAEAPAGTGMLSEREQTVAQYVVDGLTHKEIGAQLYISPKTVEHHVAKIRQKLGASTRAEMRAALRSQLAL